ncbi:hypothetical protein K438DRAFT_1952747 [Mycena galopus ATCC 62051]|nr:hypothetical protein K438DRAFT_1952747 [Mycena galopus ATCC 62051]
MSMPSSPSGEPPPLRLPPVSAPSPPSGEPVPPAELLPVLLEPVLPAEPVDKMEWGGIQDDDEMVWEDIILPGDDEGTLPEVNGLTTWASRNPRKPVQHPRERPKRVIGPERRHTLQDKLKNKKGRTAALNADLAELNKERNAKVAELAAKHKFKVPLVQQRLYGASNFKKPCKVSLFRAQEHYLAKVLNEGRGRKEHYSLHQIKCRVRTWPEFKNMSADFKAKLFKDLEMHREKTAKGACSTSKAAAQDAAYSLKRVSSEMEGILERSMYGVAFFTKGHIHDMIEPAIIQSDRHGAAL